MTSLSGLLEPQAGVLLELALGPATVRAISRRTGKTDPAVWQILALMEMEGYVKGEWTGTGAPRLPRIYHLTAKGRRAKENDWAMIRPPRWARPQ